jgi:hypothetical protein
MTLDEAQTRIGQAVIYHNGAGLNELGVITSVHADSQGGWVFVRYGADHHSKATRAEDLRTEVFP